MRPSSAQLRVTPKRSSSCERTAVARFVGPLPKYPPRTVAIARAFHLATLVVLAMGAAVLVPVEPAAATSCIKGDPRASLTGADAAFIGALVSRRPVASQEYWPEEILTFRVDETAKGNLGKLVEVRSLVGPSYVPGLGEEVGVFLWASEGGFATDGCSYVSPEQLRLARRGGPTVKKATDARAKMSFRLEGRRLTVRIARNAPRRVTRALGRPVKLVCGYSYGFGIVPGRYFPLGTATGLFRHRARKMTVVLDSDVSRTASSCGVEQAPERYIAMVLFFRYF